MSYPIQCKCNAKLGCRSGWDARVEFASPDAAREAGWIVSGNWPRYNTTCPEHAEELREYIRKMAQGQWLFETEGMTA